MGEFYLKTSNDKKKQVQIIPRSKNFYILNQFKPIALYFLLAYFFLPEKNEILELLYALSNNTVLTSPEMSQNGTCFLHHWTVQFIDP